MGPIIQKVNMPLEKFEKACHTVVMENQLNWVAYNLVVNQGKSFSEAAEIIHLGGNFSDLLTEGRIMTDDEVCRLVNQYSSGVYTGSLDNEKPALLGQQGSCTFIVDEVSTEGSVLWESLVGKLPLSKQPCLPGLENV